MNNETSHLTASAAALLAETDEQRIRAIRSRRWVLYPRVEMLRGHMMGGNKARFSSAIGEITTHTRRSVASSQLQLI